MRWLSLFRNKTFRKHLELIFPHWDFIICIVSLAIVHPHFVIRIFPSAFYHPHFSIRHPPPSGPHFSETHLSVSISSLVKFNTCNWIETNIFFLVSLICVWNLHAGSMVPGLACFALFLTHDHESVKRMSVSREMYTFLEVKLWRLRRRTYEVNDIRDKNPTACKQF